MSAKGPKPPASGNYEVGYGKPPVHTRFRKGQSGNPRGSTPRTKPWDRANQLMLKEAYRPVTVRDGERTVRMPAIAAIFRSQLVSDVSNALVPLDLDAHTLDVALRNACGLSERWLAMPPVELKSLVQEIVDRITPRRGSRGLIYDLPATARPARIQGSRWIWRSQRRQCDFTG